MMYIVDTQWNAVLIGEGWYKSYSGSLWTYSIYRDLKLLKAINYYSHAPYNDVSVNGGPYIKQ
jgi:hypothetical protein